MGVFFYIKSVALVEDVPLKEEYESAAELRQDMETGFEQVNKRYLHQTDKPFIVLF